VSRKCHLREMKENKSEKSRKMPKFDDQGSQTFGLRKGELSFDPFGKSEERRDDDDEAFVSFAAKDAWFSQRGNGRHQTKNGLEIAVPTVISPTFAKEENYNCTFCTSFPSRKLHFLLPLKRKSF